MNKCCVIGLGYIGLPTSALISNNGFEVIGVDINKDIVNKLNEGNVHLNEPDIEKLIRKSLKNKNFKAKIEPEEADIFIIAVPTPIKKTEKGNPEPELSFVMRAIQSIKTFVKKGNLILIESTCPVGTTDNINDYLIKNTNLLKEDIYIGYCPERVLPGNILFELINNDRVIGGVNSLSTKKAASFYSKFCNGKLLLTDAKTAEFVKLIENSYRDVNIAFANEISMISDELGIDPYNLINLANYHPRVNILKPGCGVGGHCIAIDPWFIVSKFPKIASLISTARNVNNKKTIWVYEKIKNKANLIKGKLGRKPKIGCLGLTFKPNVEDVRESPSLSIINKLMLDDFDLLICEPNIKYHNSLLLHDIDYVLENSDLLVFLVAHSDFLKINEPKKDYIDLCGIF